MVRPFNKYRMIGRVGVKFYAVNPNAANRGGGFKGDILCIHFKIEIIKRSRSRSDGQSVFLGRFSGNFYQNPVVSVGEVIELVTARIGAERIGNRKTVASQYCDLYPVERIPVFV